MSNKLFCAALLSLLGISGVAATENQTPWGVEFPEFRQLTPTVNDASPVGLAELDAPVYDRAAMNFSNMRLYDSAEMEIPFLVRLETEKQLIFIPTECRSKIESLNKVGDNSYEVVIELKDDEPTPVEADIQTPSLDYAKKVNVYGSNDRRNWQMLKQDAEIFDYSSIINLKNTAVTFTGSRFKYYKVRIDSFSEHKVSPYSELVTQKRQGQEFSSTEKTMQLNDTFRIDGIRLIARISRQALIQNKKVNYDVADFKADGKINKDDVFTITTFRQPLTEITVLSDSVNFYRRVRLSGCDDQKNWRQVAESTICMVTIGNKPRGEMKLNFPEHRFKYYRLTIINGDSPSINISGVKPGGNSYAMLFIVPKAPMQPLRLYYGAAAMSSPVYDLTAVLNKANIENYRRFMFGKVESNPLYQPRKQKDPLLGGKYLFLGAIGLMVIILGWLLVRGVKKIESLPDGQ